MNQSVGVFSGVVSEIEQKLSTDNRSSRRLFHGRGHCYQGLEFINVDYHPGLVFITLYQEPLEEQDIIVFSQYLAANYQLSVVIQRRYLRPVLVDVVAGVLPDPCVARTDDMLFQLSINAKQNIGYFLDMQQVHRWVRAQAKGKRVLNLFAYTCAFSVAALAGSAHSVVNVDMSGGALSVGRINHQLNQLDKRASRFMKLDILKSWGRIKKPGPYDLLIIDPPSMQRGSFVADQDYLKVVRRIPELLVPGGEVLLCLNAPHLGVDFLTALMAEACGDCVFVERLTVGDDFPERDENKNLKVLLFRYLPS